ncbi:MAG: molybdopterin-dependent oxidoreductase [Coriobacteriia bacterium]
MKRRTAIATALTALLLLAGCSADPGPQSPEVGPVNPPVTELGDVEVLEYEGEKLDSSDAFRENSIAGPQDVDVATYELGVSGLVDDPVTYTYSEVTSGFPSFEKIVRLDCVEGWGATILWRGVLVRDILDASGVRDDARSVVFSAVDGFTTSFPVAYFYDNDILLAYSMNGVTLPGERGFPFQLVAEDKWGYKWCKWVTGIELVADEDPGGYWEDRGYANDGDLGESFYGD